MLQKVKSEPLFGEKWDYKSMMMMIKIVISVRVRERDVQWSADVPTETAQCCPHCAFYVSLGSLTAEFHGEQTAQSANI